MTLHWPARFCRNSPR